MRTTLALTLAAHILAALSLAACTGDADKTDDDQVGTGGDTAAAPTGETGDTGSPDTTDTGTTKPPEPGVRSVSVQGGTTAEVAQGRSASLILGGFALDDVTSVQVDGTLACAITEQTDREVRCDLSVPHGHPLLGLENLPRPVDVRARTEAGPLPGGIESLLITPVTVDSAATTAGRGTPTEPYRSLTGAAKDGIEGGDVVDLAAGDYRDDAGETWPLAWAGDATLRGLGTVRLIATSGGTFLSDWEGPAGGAPSRLQNLELRGFDVAIDALQGRLELTDVRITEATQTGLLVGGTATVELANDAAVTTIADGDGVGIRVEGSGTLDATDAVVEGHDGAGLAVVGGTVTWRGGRLEANGAGLGLSTDLTNLYVGGGTVTVLGTKAVPVLLTGGLGTNVGLDGGVLEIEHAEITNALRHGVELVGSTALELSQVVVSGNGDAGIDIDAAATGTLYVRDTTFSDQRGSGVYTRACIDHDLGNLGDPGGNRFENNVTFAYEDDEAQLWVDFPAFCYETFAAVGTTFVQKGGITTSPTNCVYGPDRFTPENGLAPDYRIDSYGTIRFNAAGECD